MRFASAGVCKNETKTTSILSAAEETFENLLDWIKDPVLCGRPRPEVEAGGCSVLGEVMCVASLSLDFYSILNSTEAKAKYGAKIREAMRLVRQHYDPGRMILMEHATVGGVDSSTAAGRLFNPGHSIEVAWFLLQMVQIYPDPELEQIAFISNQIYHISV